MKRIYSGALLMVAIIAVSLWSSCRFGCIKGSGNKVTNDTKVGNFSRINVSGAFKVNLKQDSSGNVSVTADDNLQKYIHVESDGDELHIYSRKNFCNAGEMVINIGLKQVERIKGSGAVEFVSDGKLNTGDLRIGLSGASKVDLDLIASNVQIDGSGASEIDLKGQATSNKVELTGEGKVSALDFVVGSYDIHTTGASHCDINVLNSLNVNTTGASEIRYRGSPSNVNSSKTGASTLTHIN